jgi:anti-sigma B factor antagonist
MALPVQLPFSVSAVAHDGETVVTVRGDIDLYTAPDLSVAIDDCLSLHTYTLAIDLSDVLSMDSSGCRCLLRAQRKANEAAVQLELRGVTGLNLGTLQAFKLDRIFTIRPS